MSNYEAMIMTIWVMFIVAISLSAVRFFVFLAPIMFIISVIKEDLSLWQGIKLYWLLSSDLELLEEAIEAFNDGQTIYLEFFDDDGELAYYEEDFSKAN